MKRILLSFLLLASAAGAQEPPAPASGSYVCGDGNLLELQQDAIAGVLEGRRAGESFTLQQQVTRGPQRFVNGPDSIVRTGDTLLLRRAGNVRLTCERIPPAATAGVLWGTLSKLDRMALPQGTRAKVLLVDAARADAPAIEIGSMDIRTTDNQAPFWFLIRYDPARLLAPARPQLEARIQTARGELLYITDTANPLAGDGTAPPSPIELQLVRAGG